ncbi:MAG: hypothetical protein E7428_08550 [Ruminococcaceae bacterium]|nr:hypothetical protein [Oscillospiraceae bacterium]
MVTDINTSTLRTNVETRDLEVFDNTSEFAVKINESKARLIYNKYFKATSGGTVLSFFGTFLSGLTTLLTATFNDIWGIAGSSAVLSAIFVILTGVFGLLTLIWTGKWIYSLIKLNEASFIDELKGDNRTSSAGQ